MTPRSRPVSASHASSRRQAVTVPGVIRVSEVEANLMRRHAAEIAAEADQDGVRHSGEGPGSITPGRPTSRPPTPTLHERPSNALKASRGVADHERHARKAAGRHSDPRVSSQSELLVVTEGSHRKEVLIEFGQDQGWVDKERPRARSERVRSRSTEPRDPRRRGPVRATSDPRHEQMDSCICSEGLVS
jgi:hypothetical protein